MKSPLKSQMMKVELLHSPEVSVNCSKLYVLVIDFRMKRKIYVFYLGPLLGH